jgi:acyl-CoA synthetase (AMP-forming)/AMP-acid ligase II
VAAEGHHPNPEQLTEHATTMLSAHKRPRDFHFLERLPRNAVGKVQKARLAAAPTAGPSTPPA